MLDKLVPRSYLVLISVWLVVLGCSLILFEYEDVYGLESSTNPKSSENKNTDTNNSSSSFQNKSNPNSDIVNQSDDLITEYNNKAVALKNQGKYEEALKYYDKALAIDPNYTNALKNKDVVLKILGRDG